MASGTLHFSTDKTWASYRVNYSYTTTTFTIESVAVKITQYASTMRTIDGIVKINDTTIATVSNSFIIDVLDDWVDLGISGSAAVTDTVTVSFEGNSYSKFYAAAASDSLQFYITPSSQTVITNESGSGSDSGDSGDSGGSTDYAFTLFINQGEGTCIEVERTWSDNGDYTGKDEDWDRRVLLSDGAEVWYGTDVFEITAYALDGYEIEYFEHESGQLPFELENITVTSDGRYTLLGVGDASVTATAYRIDDDETGDDSGDDSGSGDVLDGNYWLIKKETLTAFADQARRLGGVEGELSTAQMLEIFASVVAEDSDDTYTSDYPVGEEATF